MDTQLNIHTIGEAVAAPIILPSMVEQTARQVFATFSEKMKAALNGREERALKLALEGHVSHKAGRVFSVHSEAGNHAYLVNLEARTCTCPDSLSGNVCKHRLAAYLVEQATKASQAVLSDTPEASTEQATAPEPQPPEEAVEKARLALHAKSQYLREAIIYALLEVEGQSVQVEVIDIDNGVALVRALPQLKDGQLTPQFPFPGKKSFTQVIAKSLTEVKIYR
jgi:LAS superfamily LD-carboxypeptidase LdcB